MLMTKEVPQVRIIVDQWNKFMRGHVFRPQTIGCAETMVAHKKAEWVDDPNKIETAAVDPTVERAVLPRARKRRKANAH